MKKQIASRLLFSVLMMLFLTMLVFGLSNMMTGNEVDLMRAENPGMTEEAYQALVHAKGLDRPVIVRYWDWLTDFLRSDMGTSSTQNRPVSEILSTRIGPTMILSFSALFLAIIIGVPLGILSAYRPYSIWDNIASAVAFLGSSVPGFALALIGIYIFSVRLNWLPTQGMYYANTAHTPGNLLIHLIMPALILSFGMLGSQIKQTRSAVLEVMNEDYIKTARSKGLSEFTVIMKHAFRNALIPIVTSIGISVPHLFGGSVTIEKIFSWPGMGTLIINSINNRDFDPIMAIAVIICFITLVTNIVLDFLYVVINPRLSRG